MKKNKARNFARDCDHTSVETLISRNDGYQETLKKCADSLHLPSGDRVFILLSSGGAVISSSSEWSLGNYMRRLHRGPSSARFGWVTAQRVHFMCSTLHLT